VLQRIRGSAAALLEAITRGYWTKGRPRKLRLAPACTSQMLYMLAIVLMVPAMVMAMCAGAIFGALAGSLIVWVGSSVGQVLAFMVGR
jgi:hypothetical protein